MSDFVEIVIKSKRHGEKVCLIDSSDFEFVSKYILNVKKSDRSFYVRIASKELKGKALHRVLLNAPEGVQVDHKNHNPLDNRRENIRLATPSQNGRNKPPSKLNTSSFKGVRWSKQKRAWNVTLAKNGVRYFGGYYDCKIDAAHAYNELATFHFREFAYLNVITPEQEAARMNQKRNPIRGMGRKSKSPYKGVDKLSEKCFAARISINNKKKHLGCFKTAEEAALAYNNKAIELYGITIGLNLIP